MTRGLMWSSAAASFWTHFDILSASTTAWRSISSSGMPVGGILTAIASTLDPTSAKRPPQSGQVFIGLPGPGQLVLGNSAKRLTQALINAQGV
jgi:hypothetical protein